MSEVLRTEGLTRLFGANRAVGGVSLTVEAGMLHCIIGPNGAGKTTLFNLLTKDLAPSAGRILLKGEDVTREPPHRIARRGVGRSYQITSVFQAMTVLDNVRVARYRALRGGRLAFWRGAEGDAALDDGSRAVLARVGLEGHADRPAAELAYGDQRLLEIAVTLATDPELILLDEPTAGLSQDETRAVARLIAGLKGRYTIVMIEHKMDVVMDISDRLTVMSFGEVIAEGAPAAVADDPAVRAAYFGT